MNGEMRDMIARELRARGEVCDDTCAWFDAPDRRSDCGACLHGLLQDPPEIWWVERGWECGDPETDHEWRDA